MNAILLEVLQLVRWRGSKNPPILPILPTFGTQDHGDCIGTSNCWPHTWATTFAFRAHCRWTADFFCVFMCTIILDTLDIAWIYLPSNLAASTSILIFRIMQGRQSTYIHYILCISKSIYIHHKCSTWDRFSNFSRCQMTSVARWPEPTLAPWMPSTADLDFHAMRFLTQRCLLAFWDWTRDISCDAAELDLKSCCDTFWHVLTTGRTGRTRWSRGCRLWASLCHWRHVGQDVRFGQGIPADPRGGALSARPVWYLLMLCWQVKDGPDAAYPFRALWLSSDGTHIWTTEDVKWTSEGEVPWHGPKLQPWHLDSTAAIMVRRSRTTTGPCASCSSAKRMWHRKPWCSTLHLEDISRNGNQV